MVVLVTSAKLEDGAAAPQVLDQISVEEAPRLRAIFGDNKYNNRALNEWLATHRPDWRIEIKSPPEGVHGFVPVRKRWVVERTNAWTGRARRSSKDYERKTESSTAMVRLSAINTMLNRLAPKPGRAEFHYRSVGSSV